MTNEPRQRSIKSERSDLAQWAARPGAALINAGSIDQGHDGRTISLRILLLLR